MKILFANPPYASVGHASDPGVPPAHIYLASALRAQPESDLSAVEGVEVLLDDPNMRDGKEFVKIVSEYGPDILAATVNESEISAAARYFALMRKEFP